MARRPRAAERRSSTPCAARRLRTARQSLSGAPGARGMRARRCRASRRPGGRRGRPPRALPGQRLCRISSRAGGRSSAAGAPWRPASRASGTRPPARTSPAAQSGSGGAPMPVPADLEFLRDRAVNSLMVLSAREGLAWRHATWAVPGSDALVPILRLAVAGARPSRWFALVSAAAPGLHPRYRWSARVLSWATDSGRRHPPSRARFPGGSRPHRPLDRRGTRRAGATAHLYGLVSPVVRLCQIVRAAGIDITGTQFTVTGEPLTAARLSAIHKVGAEARPHVRERRGRRHRRGLPPPRHPG